MDFIPADPILEFNPTTLEDVRKCWNLENGRMSQSVDILEAWLSKQNHFVNKKFSRTYLERVLIVCKGSVEKSKSQIDKLCTLKTLLPKFFIGGGIRELAYITETFYAIPLPKMTKDHYRPAIMRVNSKEFTSEDIMPFFRLALATCEYLKAHDYANGFIVIEDFRDANLMDIMTKLNFVDFQQLMAILIEGFGARLKGIYILTQSKIIDLFIKTFKPMLSAKLADRIQVFRDLEELHGVIDKKILPVEYGGEVRSVEKLKDEWLDVLSSEENEKYLAVVKATCTDESLRPSEKFNEQIMGLPGTFRTLNVD